MPFKVKPMINNWYKLGKFYRASTKGFEANPTGESKEQLGEYTRIFVPNKCLKGGCHLHVFLHGCTQARREVFF
jgi:hypothetical protein